MFQNVVNCKRKGIEQLRYQGLVLGAGCWGKAPNRGGIQDMLGWQKKVEPEVEILVLDFLQKHLWVGRCLVTEYGPGGPGCSGSSGAGSQEACASLTTSSLLGVPLESYLASLGLTSLLPNRASTLSTPWIHREGR